MKRSKAEKSTKFMPLSLVALLHFPRFIRRLSAKQAPLRNKHKIYLRGNFDSFQKLKL